MKKYTKIVALITMYVFLFTNSSFALSFSYSSKLRTIKTPTYKPVYKSTPSIPTLNLTSYTSSYSLPTSNISNALSLNYVNLSTYQAPILTIPTYTIPSSPVYNNPLYTTPTVNNDLNLYLNTTESRSKAQTVSFLTTAIRGSVYDRKSDPMGDVRVSVGNIHVSTAPNGFYELRLLAGRYTMVFTKAGYETYEKKVTLLGGGVVDIDPLIMDTLYKKVSGYVYDEKGIPLEGARISFAEGLSTHTDPGGYYETSLKKGNYELTFAKGFHTTVHRSLAVEAKDISLPFEDITLEALRTLIHGHVCESLDGTRRVPLEGVKVSITGDDQACTYTLQNGYYGLYMDRGTHELIFTKEGYQTGTVPVKAEALSTEAPPVILDPLGGRAVASYSFSATSDTTILDSSPYKNHGIPHQMIWTEGRFGGGLSFEENNYICFNKLPHYVEIPDSPSLKPSRVSVEAWVRFDNTKLMEMLNKNENNQGTLTTNQIYSLFGQDRAGIVDNDGYMMITGSFTNQVTFGVCVYRNGTSGTYAFAGWSPVVADHEWHHYVGTYDGGDVVLYMDGAPVAQFRRPGEIAYSSCPLEIGRRNGYKAPDACFKGGIDEVRIYNDALPPVAIQGIYSNPQNAPQSVTIFEEDFEEGAIGGEWTTSTTHNGRVRITRGWAYNGEYAVALDASPYDAEVYSRSCLDLSLNLDHTEAVIVEFEIMNYFNEAHAEDGLFVSVDGGHAWKRIFPFDYLRVSDMDRIFVDLSGAASLHGLELGADTRIRWQFYDNACPGAWWDTSISDFDGYIIDDITITGTILEDSPPLIEVISPQDYATVWDVVEIQARAHDTTGIRKVAFFVEGVLQDVLTPTPDDIYTFYWDSWKTTNIGPVPVQVIAYDHAGNQTECPLWLNVTNVEPIIGITTLRDGERVDSGVPISIEARTNFAKRVEWYINGELIRTDTKGFDEGIVFPERRCLTKPIDENEHVYDFEFTLDYSGEPIFITVKGEDEARNVTGHSIFVYTRITEDRLDDLYDLATSDASNAGVLDETWYSDEWKAAAIMLAIVNKKMDMTVMTVSEMSQIVEMAKSQCDSLDRYFVLKQGWFFELPLPGVFEFALTARQFMDAGKTEAIQEFYTQIFGPPPPPGTKISSSVTGTAYLIYNAEEIPFWWMKYSERQNIWNELDDLHFGEELFSFVFAFVTGGYWGGLMWVSDRSGVTEDLADALGIHTWELRTILMVSKWSYEMLDSYYTTPDFSHIPPSERAILIDEYGALSEAQKGDLVEVWVGADRCTAPVYRQCNFQHSQTQFIFPDGTCETYQFAPQFPKFWQADGASGVWNYQNERLFQFWVTKDQAIQMQSAMNAYGDKIFTSNAWYGWDGVCHNYTEVGLNVVGITLDTNPPNGWFFSSGIGESFLKDVVNQN